MLVLESSLREAYDRQFLLQKVLWARKPPASRPLCAPDCKWAQRTGGIGTVHWDWVQGSGEWAASPDPSCVNTAVFCCAAHPYSWPVRVGHLSISQLCCYLWKKIWGLLNLYLYSVGTVSRLPAYCHLALFLLLLFLKFSMIARQSWY